MTLSDYLEGKTPFTLILDDPAGNSNIENLCAPNPDPNIIEKRYKRTNEQIEALGLQPESEVEPEMPLDEQVHVFPGNCSRCHAPSETKMHLFGK